ncbi:hypothetical protein BS47DRAFT_1340546 [Hydnum rufescens UP504]|uniref:ER membrane protein complex subunit 1 n=1 Tax=Hydnum rufescens UP504 TaxID=1448309 RepID=A0A9P6B5G0_9AGAM|nr:hypothetical protein BS47DRAFT_1340546 [Hydnum rufescens UP504]
MRLRILSLLIFSVASVFSLHESDAGVTDWHKPLVGIPLTHSISTSPRFHRIFDHKGTESRVFVATKRNTLASLDPILGTIAWRHVFDEDEHIVHVQAHRELIVSLSGSGTSKLRAHEARTGFLLWETPLHDSFPARLSEPGNTYSDLMFTLDGEDDIIVLSNSRSVRRLDHSNGNVKWEWTPTDQTSLNLHSRIVASRTAIHVIAFAKSFASYTLHVTTIDPLNGKEINTYHIPSSIQNGISHIVIIDRIDNPYIAWAEKGSIKSYDFVTGHITSAKEKNYAEIIDIGLGQQGLFVGIQDNGAAHIFSVGRGQSQGPIKIWEFADSATTPGVSPSIYTGGLDKEGRGYISRVFYSLALQSTNLHLFSPHGAEGKGMVTGFTFPFDTNSHGVIDHVALDVAHPQEYRFISRVVLTTSTGAVQLWQQDSLQWTREESLSEIKAIEFVDLPEKKILHSNVGEAFAQKLQRQVAELQNLPSYIIHFGTRFLTGKYETVSSPSDPNAPVSLYRDTFGFHKLLVLLTSTGKAFGVDTSRGRIVWDRILGISDARGSSLSHPRLLVSKSVWDDSAYPELLVIARDLHKDAIIMNRLDALTGKLIQRSRELQPLTADIYFLPDQNKTILVVDENLKIHIYPNNRATRSAFSDLAPRLHFSLRRGAPSRERIDGFRIDISSLGSHSPTVHRVWSFAPPPSESVQYVVKPPRDPAASFGKALADRSTLYKYLNPHVICVVTKNTDRSHGSVYLIDSVTGATLYQATVSSSRGLQATLIENWLVYTYFSDETNAKGQRIVSVELYEGSTRNEKTSSPDSSSFVYDNVRVTPYQQSFLFPHSVNAVGMTTTKYGISAKDFIVANDKSQIQTFSRRLLDPRRHKNKPSAADAEELLTPYDPVVGDDPRHVLSHSSEVAGIRHIITSPALLESTSLVFAYGLDLFFTRVAPSGTFDVLSVTFNKLQLVLTVLGLAVAILVTRPIVQRQQLRQRWYT